MKPLFTESPAAWTRTARLSQTPAEYATAIEREPSGTKVHPAEWFIAALFVAVVLAFSRGWL